MIFFNNNLVFKNYRKIVVRGKYSEVVIRGNLEMNVCLCKGFRVWKI